MDSFPPLPALLARLKRLFRRRAHRYGLDPARVEVRYVLNLGGFVNASFTVMDGLRRYHLKLAFGKDEQQQLRRWQSLAPHLEAHYRAPHLLDWIELPGWGYAGPLFEHIEGRPLQTASEPQLVRQVLTQIETLHTDTQLAVRLREHGVRGDARQSVLSRLLVCAEEDLREDGAEFPVSAELREWMAQETAKLRTSVETDPAWDAVPAVPIHCDLWEQNLLITADGNWYVLDWDDLTLGDPVLDYVLLLWPLEYAASDNDRGLPLLGERDPAFLSRYRLCSRINLLVEAIDTLADWVTAARWPEQMATVRTLKLRAHEEALAAYRRAC